MKKRLLATVTAFCMAVALLITPAAALTDAEQSYDNLESIAELIKNFGLESSGDDNPLKNMLIKMMEEDPEAFYTLANMMLSYYDSHSMYLKADEYSTAFPTNIGGYVGVGITIDTKSGNNMITYVTPQSPAEQAGVLAGDILTAIDGNKLDGLTSEEIVNRIRGTEGSPVTLTVLRSGKELSFTMNRKQIGRPNFENYTVEPGIEYMRLAQFNGTDTLNRFNLAYSQLDDKQTKVLILDLRGNPGGLLNMAEYMINAFVPDKGKYMYAAENRKAKNGLYVFESDGTGIKLNNIYILVDENSASASEIMSGSLRDLGYAKLIGTNTYGKSTGQIHFTSSSGDTVVVTVQKHILPKGESFEGVGLKPNYAVENYQTNYPIPKDLQELDMKTDVYLTHNSEKTLAIEQRLKLLGYFSETPDRNFNEATINGVNAFRRANGLLDATYCSTSTISLLEQKTTELSKKVITVDAQFNKALELAREDAKKDILYTVDEDGNFVNK